LTTEEVQVFLGLGDGSFAAPTSVHHKAAVSVSIADLDANGWPDVATAADKFGVNVSLGQDDGLSAATTWYAGDIGAHALAIADVTADGVLDVTIFGAYMGVLPGLGDGGFAPGLRFSGAGYYAPYHASMDAGDLNADGAIDVVTPSSSAPAIGSASVAVFLNQLLY
jgi:hypothetical protein